MQKTIKLLIMLTAVACVSLTVRAQSVEVTGIKKLKSTTVEVICKDGNRISFDFYGDNIFRLFRDIRGGLIRNPESDPKADILVNNPRKPVSKLETGIDGDFFFMRTPVVEVRLDKKSSCVTVIRISDNQPVVKELNPTLFNEDNVSLTLSADSNNEYFYGGGVQKTVFQSLRNRLAAKAGLLDQGRRQLDACRNRVEGIEQGHLVLLQIPIIC